MVIWFLDNLRYITLIIIFLVALGFVCHFSKCKFNINLKFLGSLLNLFNKAKEDVVEATAEIDIILNKPISSEEDFIKRFTEIIVITKDPEQQAKAFILLYKNLRNLNSIKKIALGDFNEFKNRIIKQLIKDPIARDLLLKAIDQLLK